VQWWRKRPYEPDDLLGLHQISFSLRLLVGASSLTNLIVRGGRKGVAACRYDATVAKT
jgi:hypothetical protein